MAKISIVIPVYNSEKYLSLCLDSILNQTYSDFEVLCTNDGSTDNSDKILEEYANKDNRIKVINQQNQGISSARNSGLKSATGEYICFLDNDDLMHPQYLELMLDTLKKSNCNFIWCNYDKFSSDKDVVYKKYNNLNYKVVTNIWNRFLKRKKPHPSITIWNKLFKKEVLKDIYFNENIRLGEDFIFSHYYLIKTEKACFLPYSLIFYRKHEKAFSNNENITYFLDIYYGFCEIFLKEFYSNLKTNYEIKRVQSRIVKMLLEQFIKRPYDQDLNNCEQYWDKYGDKLNVLYKEKLINYDNIGIKYKIFSYLLINKKYKILKLILSNIKI